MSNEKDINVEMDSMKERFGIDKNELQYSPEVAKEIGVLKYQPEKFSDIAVFAGENTQSAHKEKEKALIEEKEAKISYDEIKPKKENELSSFEKDFQAQFQAQFETDATNEVEIGTQKDIQNEAKIKEAQKKKSEIEYKKEKLNEMTENKSGYEEKTSVDELIEKQEEKIEKSDRYIGDLSNESPVEDSLKVEEEPVEKEEFSMKDVEHDKYMEEMNKEIKPSNIDYESKSGYYVQTFAHANNSKTELESAQRSMMQELGAEYRENPTLDHGKHVVGGAREYVEGVESHKQLQADYSKQTERDTAHYR